MYVFETAVRNGDGCGGKMYMAVYLRLLAAQTCLSVPPYEFAHTCPAKFAADKLDCRLYTWMSDAVQGGDGSIPEGGRNQRSEDTGGDVTEQFNSLYLLRGDKQGSAVTHFATVGACDLCGGHRRVVDGRRYQEVGCGDDAAGVRCNR
jgi:hypothetical protein